MPTVPAADLASAAKIQAQLDGRGDFVSLNCKDIASFAALEKYPHLQYLGLVGKPAPLETLPALPSLRSLHFYAQPDSLASLARLPALREVSFSASRPLLSGLAALPHLETLDLSSCKEVRDVGPLALCRSLRSLALPSEARGAGAAL